MTVDDAAARPGLGARLRAQKWLVIVPAVVSAATTYAISLTLPDRYRSHTTIQVVPQRVGTDVVRPVVTIPVDERRQPGGVSVFRVSYTASEPRTAMKVTERLAGLIIDESLNDRIILAEGTLMFVQSQIESVRKRLLDHDQLVAAARAGGKPTEALVLEHQVLQDTYRSLLARAEEVRIAQAMEARQVGEQFRALDAASYPERPEGPHRLPISLAGAGAGLGLGLLIAALRRCA
jgi:uncharacterized protein involved in exopolysaccharide biosynthesis